MPANQISDPLTQDFSGQLRHKINQPLTFQLLQGQASLCPDYVPWSENELQSEQTLITQLKEPVVWMKPVEPGQNLILFQSQR